MRAVEGAATRPLRLVLLINSLGPGGAEGVLARLASEWARGGDDVALVTLATRSVDFFPIDPAVQRIALDAAGDSASRWAAVAANLRRIARLRATVRARRPDLVLSFVDRTNVLALAACLGTALPIVVCERTDPTRHVLERPWALLRRLLYRRATAVVVQHEGLRRWAEELCDPGRVLVLANPVAIDPRPAAAPDALADGQPACAAAPPRAASAKIWALGRLSPEKGFERLIAAFAIAAGRIPGWTLVLTGDGPERARLAALVAAGGLEGRVTLRGLARDPWQGARAGDVFVLPSRYEGMSNALLEAMARGLAPIVTSEAAAAHGIVVDGASGVVVSDGSAAALAAAIERVAVDAELRTRLATAAVGRVERYAAGRVAAQWRDALTELLARVPPARPSHGPSARGAGPR